MTHRVTKLPVVYTETMLLVGTGAVGHYALQIVVAVAQLAFRV